ncbi:MAG: S8 family serine peptidase [Acidobacteriota bacterium]
MLGLLAVVSAAALAGAQDRPEIRSRQDVPLEVQRAFERGDQAREEVGFPGYALERRSERPAAGLDRTLLDRPSSSSSLAIAGWSFYPSAEQWTRWRSYGLHYLESLGPRLWLVELRADAGELFDATEAESLTAFAPLDKVARVLDRPSEGDNFYDAERSLVVVDLTLNPSARESEREALKKDSHVADVEHLDRSSERTQTLVLDPQTIEKVADSSAVLWIKPGAWRQEVLMDGVRPAVSGDVVLDSQGVQLTGAGIRAATRENLYGGSVHEAFWNHDASGAVTTPRWTAVAETSCVHKPYAFGGHALMTAGILLGNGWFSDQYTDDPEAFRGIAPEAIWECYHQSGARAHVSSHSYPGTDSFWDRAVRGDSTAEVFHAHTVAAGNSGLSGYRSLINPSKNAMVVGNSQVRGPIHPSSSAGPSLDGRIKPDITAPTSDLGAYNKDPFSLEISEISIQRGASSVVEWRFNASGPAWHLGWGEPSGSFGAIYLDIDRLFGGSMGIDVHAPPWGQDWQNTPILGTATLPSSDPSSPGAPLAIQGHEDDVLVIRYRALPTGAQGLGYFNITPTWLRCFPNGSPGCSGNTFWYSQSRFEPVGIGDGTWRTLEVPIGTASGTFFPGNMYWDDAQTWAGESIEWLGLRFRVTEGQPTPSIAQGYGSVSAGTSGASPVVGGAYALAMEHLERLYLVDLDATDTRSPYYAGLSNQLQLVAGMPYNSTWKALFIHTADDMVRLRASSAVPSNPDTGYPDVYHRGPDYSTGYGRINIQRGIDLMASTAQGEHAHRILEHELSAGESHSYSFEVSATDLAGNDLAVTLAWDDPANTSLSLVNDLGLYLVSPTGEVHYPWSIDVPPPVITSIADIQPARRDLPNSRDNVEQVRVDSLNPSHVGIWTAYVAEHGLGGISGTQKYSLVISPVPGSGSLGF